MFDLNSFYNLFGLLSFYPVTDKEESPQTSPVATRILKRERNSEDQAIEPSRVSLLEIPLYVFRDLLSPYLKLNDLAALSFVCRDMKAKTAAMIQQAWDMRRKAMTIGPEEWKKVGVEVKDLPALPKDIDQILKEPCPFNPGKRVYQTHKLLLMPAGSSINDQGVRMRHLREGNNPNIYSYIWDQIEEKLGNNKFENSYWALITCDVIPGSRNQDFTQQKELLERYPGYTLPTALEAINLVTMNLECSGVKREYLLPENPRTLTRCMQFNDWLLVVGAFAPSGLSVNDYPSGCADDPYGFLAVRRFC